MPAATTYEIGVNLAGAATLASQGITNPESTFIDYSSSVKLGNGLVKGIGFPQTEWHYGFIPATEYDLLRAYCLTAGANVCIATMNNDRDFVRYNCQMEMPLQFVIRATRYVDVTIKFSGMELAE